ncbi:ImmA/IrrE family metallo-endopeptidase [Bifidobacterium crudilactis]|jgi:Zn-dependent peptidase ImmA (M78 family)|uniref:ImmA/IrrE family metallo-endopeptidase n=1 Tax=Bifidobacterium crudilactis TaxID=327277 RepID=UPI002357262D|nr:ImmA/IrrE family metallo-endopeptidase [Bifidobacterium crudilactis]
MPERDFHIDCSMTYGDMRRYAEALDVAISSELLPAGVKGIYDENLRMIIIDRSLDYTQKRCTLVHELFHWSYFDNSCDPVLHAKAEKRTRRLTAELLVPAKRFDCVDPEYEGDAALIANDMNVTMQVLRDYKELVLDRRQYA